MAVCINCHRDVGCSCRLLNHKYCSEKCKNEYIEKNESVSNMQQLPRPQESAQSDRVQTLRDDKREMVEPNI